MKIAAAQTRALKGDVEGNIAAHILMIRLAVTHVVDLIVFPELSLTGYEPQLANELATTSIDPRFNDFQILSDNHRITICAGMPIRCAQGIRIGMLIFQPHQEVDIYAKQYLHQDEWPFFVKGQEQYFFNVDDVKIAPAICYESLLPDHVANASTGGAQLYLTSVAKSELGVAKAVQYYSQVAKKYSLPVVMSNAVGVCDTFVSAGQSSIWDINGSVIAQLDSKSEGIILFDTTTGHMQTLLNT